MIEIIVSPVGKPGQFSASINGRVIVASSRTPFLTAARALIAEGISPATIISMRHAGSAITSLRSAVGHAAKLTVRESNTTGPRFEGLRLEGPFRFRRASAHALFPESGREEDWAGGSWDRFVRIGALHGHAGCKPSPLLSHEK